MKTGGEIWQGYTEWGEATPEPLTRSQAAAGKLHGASHVWIWRHPLDCYEEL